MQLYFITYSDNNYSTFQDRLIAKAEASGEFDHVIGYTREWLETTQFYKDNKALLDQTIGGGFWCWKHFIILTTIDKMADDDILLYLDCGDDFLEGIGQFLKETMQTKDFLLTDGAFMNYDWTKKECFVMMKCDNENYWYTIQLEAGIIVLKRTLFVKQLLEEWGTYCKIPEIINNDNITSDFPSFKEHRNDQSILTNLKTKHNLYSDISLRRMINCNVHSIPSISINVTIHNKAFLLPQVLGSIKKFTTGKYELILLFDGCFDNSLEIGRKFRKDNPDINIKILEADDVFETKANNIAAKASSGDIIIILQDDVLINEMGWNQRMIKPFMAFDDVFAVTSNTAHNWTFNPLSVHQNDLSEITRNDCWCDIIEHCDHADRNNTPRNVFAIRDCVNRSPLAINHVDLEGLDYFNEEFAPQDSDDHDLCYRMHKRMNKVVGCYWIDYISLPEWGGTRDEDGNIKNWVYQVNHKNAKLLYQRHSEIMEKRTIDQRILN